MATFLDLSIFILSSILLHAFLLSNLSHSFLKRLLHTHHALHQAAHKSCLSSTANMEFIEGPQEETVCLLFSSYKVQGNKSHCDSQPSIFPLYPYIITLQHHSILRENKYCIASLICKQSQTKGRIWPRFA